MIILKITLILLFLMIPLLVGVLFDRKLLIDAYLYGQIMMWALFQVIAVPSVFFKLSFNSLVIIYCGLLMILSVFGAIKLPEVFKQIEKPRISIPLVLALIVILGQMMVYFLGMHLDEDDARWLAEANDAIVKNKMLLYNPATGSYVGAFRGEVLKDVFSPWSMYIAYFSRVTSVNVAVMAHTILAPVLLGISYMVYYKISQNLFKGETTESGLFLLSVSVINMFFGGNRHTQSFTTLIRIWQGKAIIAAVMIPMLFLVFLDVQEEDSVKNWLWIMVIGCSSCLFSGIGIAISLIIISVFGTYIIVRKKWNRIPFWILSMVPAIMFGLGYYMMRQ